MSLFRSSIFFLFVALFLPVTQASSSASELLAAGRVDDAIASLQQQLKSSPADAGSYFDLCRAYYSVQDWDRAISTCEKASSLSPANSDYFLWLGRAYGEKAERVNPLSAYSLARKLRRAFETSVELNPMNVDARVDLAEFYLEAPGILGGGTDKARSQARVLSRISVPRSHYLYGRIAEKDKDSVRAEKEYRAAIDASNGNANDWLNLALFFRHQNRPGDMEQALLRAADAPSGRNDVLVECASLLLGSGRSPSSAAQLVRRYLSSGTPSDKAPLFQAHYVLGTALEKQGDSQGAAQEYRAALSLASNFPVAKEALRRVSR
jgi:tetratricopeptide (TPR) repeat protein